MALTASRSLSGKVDGRTAEIPIKNASVIFEGAIVAIDGNGQALPISHATASLRFAGIAIKGGTGNAGLTETCVVERRGTRWLPHQTTANVNMVGKLAYAFDDEKVHDDAGATTNDYIVGRIVAVNASTNMVEVDLNDRVA
jgi:hypothetical protein